MSEQMEYPSNGVKLLYCAGSGAFTAGCRSLVMHPREMKMTSPSHTILLACFTAMGSSFPKLLAQDSALFLHISFGEIILHHNSLRHVLKQPSAFYTEERSPPAFKANSFYKDQGLVAFWY